jgi:hypothetical protein
MNSIPEMKHMGRYPTNVPGQTSLARMGLGPSQLTWLRQNINAFKEAENQRLQMQQDSVRAARIAGLI